MKRYFIAPRSGEKSYKNFASSIKHGVPYKHIEKYLYPEGKQVLQKEEVVYAWGNRKGKQSEWKKITPGDTVIFYASGNLVMAGDVIYKQFSHELALAMWPPDENGQPWSYTFFLTNLRYFKIPLTHFNLASGYKFRSIQGFQEINEPYRTKILELYNDFEVLFSAFNDEESVEIPKEKERVYVNISNQVQPELSDRNLVEFKMPLTTNGFKNKKKGFVDFEEVNKHRSKIGSMGEEIVIRYEKDRLIKIGKSELATKVQQLSLEDTYAGFDVISYEADGAERKIEVKATTKGLTEDFTFRISRNEKMVAEQENNYHIYLVFAVNTNNPKIHILNNPFKNTEPLLVEPVSFIVRGRFSNN